MRNSLISRRGSEWNRKVPNATLSGVECHNSPGAKHRRRSTRNCLPNPKSPSSESARRIFGVVAVRTIVCGRLHYSIRDKRIMGTDSSHRILLSKTYSVISDAYQLSLGLGWEYKGIEWKVWILSTPAIFNCLCQLIAHEQSGLSQSHSSAIENQSPPKTGSPFHGLMSLISAWRVQSRSRLTLRKSAAIPDPSCTRSTV